MDEGLLRATPLVAAIGVAIFLFLGVRRFVKSWTAALSSVLLLAFAPIFVFYATDFIQEMILAFSLAMMFYSGVRYLTRQDGEKLKMGSWAIIFGAGAGLAFSTKETCVLSFAAILISFIAMCAMTNGEWKQWFSKKRTNDFILMTISFFLVVILFYSAFATDFEGVKRVFVDAPFSYLQRASGSEMSDGASSHVHEWWWYLKLLFCPESIHWSRFSTMPFMKALSRTVSTGWRFTEFPLLIAAIVPLFFTRFVGDKDRYVKYIYFFSLFYFISLLLMYSLIPYKTPWCMLTVFQAMALAAATGIGVIVNTVGINKFIKPIMVTAILLAVSVVHWRGVSFMSRVPDSTAIPYNYAQASYDVKNLSAKILNELQAAKEGEYAAIILPSCDTWPIPWYVRKFSDKVGYWTDFESFSAMAKDGKPKCIVVAESDSENVRTSFPEYTQEFGHAVRPGVFVRLFTKEGK
jgi:predicted membrane-bound mannosyltransferase